MDSHVSAVDLNSFHWHLRDTMEDVMDDNETQLDLEVFGKFFLDILRLKGALP